MIKSILAAAAVLIAVVVVCWSIVWIMTVPKVARNKDTAKSLSDSLAARFQSHRFTGGGGYEEPGIRITVFGSSDKSVQAEIREWLTAEKARRQLDTQIVLVFFDAETGAEVEKFEL